MRENEKLIWRWLAMLVYGVLFMDWGGQQEAFVGVSGEKDIIRCVSGESPADEGTDPTEIPRDDGIDLDCEYQTPCPGSLEEQCRRVDTSGTASCFSGRRRDPSLMQS